MHEVTVSQSSGERTELELAEIFVERYGAELRYSAAMGGWQRYDGAQWIVDQREHHRECVKDVARAVAAEAAALMDDELFKSARRASSARGVDAILNLARSDARIAITPDDVDRDPWLLNCANGTVDLRSGELRPHRRSDLITRCLPVTYDPVARAPRFHQFLAEVQPDEEVRRYLARFFGYSAVGVVSEHVIGVFWGPGANGKSALADAVTYVLGSYARVGPSSLIVSNGGHEPHPADIATCRGARLMLVHETRRGAGFDASKIKLLTGGDRLTARGMRENFYEFTPSHTLVMLTNYMPQADASDSALWRRVQLVPFNVVVPEAQRDPLLSEKLRAEASGILRWIVEGALEWQRMKLAPPTIVREQTAAYRAAEDVIGAFLEERVDRVAQASVKAGDLYQAYRAWCEANGVRPVRTNDFAGEILRRGFTREERAAGRIYRGLGLRRTTEGES